jgi:pSer/pThr/pTyr-binding forkhead associated (FHA) protein
VKNIYYLVQENGKPVRVEEGQEITIGRAFDNSIYIDDASVSRHHAVIKWKKGMMYITDLSSTNGTFVNSEKITSGYYYELNYSDEIRVGNIALMVVDEAAVITKNFSKTQVPAQTVVMTSHKIEVIDEKDFESKV